MKDLVAAFSEIPKIFGQILTKNQQDFGEICENYWQNWQNSAKNSAIFNEKIEIRERCKGVHCVDLGESFPTSIYLQNLALIQPPPPRTNPVKFA